NGGSSTNPITGIGLTPGQFSVSPPSLSFGTIAVGSNAQASFLLTNSGGTPITNGTASINDGGFTIISGTPFHLGGFWSPNLLIRFTPTNASLFSNAVVFTTPVAGSTNPVTGTGAVIPSANFSASPTIGAVPLTVNFTDGSSGTITNRFWDFGDGSTTNTSA